MAAFRLRSCFSLIKRFNSPVQKTISSNICRQNCKKLHLSATALTSANNKGTWKLPNSEWEKRLTTEQFYVTRERGTETPFTGEFYSHFEKGMYQCACCQTPLFSSEDKFDSGTGWPSFNLAYGSTGSNTTTSNVTCRSDHSTGVTRTEVICKECDAHLGHVFEDGPAPTGLRYCMNSVALKFISEDDS